MERKPCAALSNSSAAASSSSSSRGRAGGWPAMEVLPDGVVGEILLRFPPSDPASLVRAALVCKPWCRIVCGPTFRRRFVELHRVAPLLGFLCNTSSSSPRFVPTSSFRRPPPHDCECEENAGNCLALDARHGLVLLDFFVGVGLVVWDPTTDERWKVAPAPDICDSRLYWHATVLRAPTANGNRDDTPFVVVRVVTQSSRQRWCLRVYSSEDASWGEQTLLPYPECRVDNAPTALVGNKLYFMMNSCTSVLSFDLATRETSVIHLPPKASECATELMAMEEDAVLGFARLDRSATFSLWSMEANPNGGVGWTQTRAIELEKLRPLSADSIYCPFIGLAHAAGVFFVATFEDGSFRFDLKSGQVSKVCEVGSDAFGFIGRLPCVVPYTGFCTPGCLRY